MRLVQWKSGCDYYLLSYEHFYLPSLPSKMGSKKCFFTPTIGMPLPANGDCDVTESYLEWRS